MVLGRIAAGGNRRGCLRFLPCRDEIERSGMGGKRPLRSLQGLEIFALPGVVEAVTE
jgi:hypothetical protein